METKHLSAIPIIASDGRSITDHIEPFFYNPHGSPKYWMKQESGTYTPLPGIEDIKRHLVRGGLCAKSYIQPGLSEIQEAIAQIQVDKQIYYAGPLAGYMTGLYEFTNGKGLITSSPNLIEPKEGDYSIIQVILKNLLGDKQLTYFQGWLQIAVKSLRSNARRTGQAVVFAGEQDCGKSLVQNQIITPLVGGRTSKPYPWMTGKTDFNSDIFKGEHLSIQDEYGSTDIRSRRQFGASLKQIVANEEQHFHQKGIEAMVTKPFWRLSISVNAEPENLTVLPILDESLKDKIFLFKCSKVNMPMPTGTNEEREKFAASIKAQLPCYLYYLLEQFIMPSSITDQRFGVKYYHHPEILGAINEMSPEDQLLEIMAAEYVSYESTIEDDNSKTFLLNSIGIYQTLTGQHAMHGKVASKILTTLQSVKTYMNRLADKKPDLVSPYTFSDKQQGWRFTLKKNEGAVTGSCVLDLRNGDICASRKYSKKELENYQQQVASKAP